LQRAVADTRRRRHEYLTLEHLLFSMLEDQSAIDVVVKCGGDIGKLKDELETFLTDNVEPLPVEEESGPDQTLAFQRVFQRAAMHVQGAGRAQMTTGNLLVAMYRERDSFAVYLLEKMGVTRFDVINYISHGVSKVDPGAGVVPRARGVDADGGAEEDAKVKNPLESFCVDLSARAAAGKIDPLIGRAAE
jgi:ATP-dependent Clp protease ATP-binding subunit ClpA